MTGLLYLFAACSAVWIILFLYLFSLSRRQQKLRADVDDLKEHFTSEEIENP